MKVGIYIILVICLGSLAACETNSKYEITIYQSFYFKKGQKYELIIDNGKYSKSRSFNRTYQSGEYKRLKVYRTNLDSIKVYFKLDEKDTSFVMPSGYTTRLAIGSNAYGKILVGTDNEENFWETQ